LRRAATPAPELEEIVQRFRWTALYVAVVSMALVVVIAAVAAFRAVP